MPLLEIFGYPDDDHSRVAENARRQSHCPFIKARCTKQNREDPRYPFGYCSVRWNNVPDGGVITCPNRLYFSNLEVLHRPVLERFGSTKHVRVKPEQQGLHREMSMDWVVAKLDSKNRVEDFFGVEVQTIDITGTVRPAFNAFMENRALT